MKDLRGPLPLTDADFAQIRANVMERVRPRRTSVFTFRWAFAMLAAAFAGVFSYKSLQVPVEPPSRPARVTVSAPPIVASPAPLPVLPAPRVAHRRVTTSRPRPRSHQPPTTNHQLPTYRLELQTADPDIRIIWLPATHEEKPEASS
jgi:hypothetical protein